MENFKELEAQMKDWSFLESETAALNLLLDKLWETVSSKDLSTEFEEVNEKLETQKEELRNLEKQYQMLSEEEKESQAKYEEVISNQKILEENLESLQKQHLQIKHEMKSLEDRVEAFKNKSTLEEKLRSKFQLYKNITNIRWDPDCPPEEAKGFFENGV